jgi:hypothetical protein
MQNQIHAEGPPAGEFLDAAYPLAQLIRRDAGAGENPESTGSADLGNHLRSDDARHRRLQHRIGDPEQVAQRRAQY